MTSLNELMEQRMKERESLYNHVDYEQNLDNRFFTKTNKPEMSYSSMEEYLQDSKIQEPNSNIRGEPKYFLVSGNNEIEIKTTGRLETDPPIITFEYVFSDLYLPTNKNNIIFKVLLNDKEFKYIFRYEKDFFSNTKYDERFEGLNIESMKLENVFSKWILVEGTKGFAHKSNDFMYILFAIHDNKLVFRQAKFAMIRDDLYKEQFK